MTRLGEGAARGRRPAGAGAARLRQQPAGQRARPEQGPPRPGPRGPVHRGRRALPDRHRRLRRPRCCPAPCRPSTPTCTSPTATSTSPGTSRRWRRRASACRTPRSSGVWPRRLGVTEPCVYDSDEDMARQVLDSDDPALAGITLEALQARGLGPPELPTPVRPVRRRLPDPVGQARVRTPSGWPRRAWIRCPAYTPPYEAAQHDTRWRARYPLALIAPAVTTSSTRSSPTSRAGSGARDAPTSCCTRPTPRRADSRRRPGARRSTTAASSAALVDVSDRCAPGVAAATKGRWPSACRRQQRQRHRGRARRRHGRRRRVPRQPRRGHAAEHTRRLNPELQSPDESARGPHPALAGVTVGVRLSVSSARTRFVPDEPDPRALALQNAAPFTIVKRRCAACAGTLEHELATLDACLPVPHSAAEVRGVRPVRRDGHAADPGPLRPCRPPRCCNRRISRAWRQRVSVPSPRAQSLAQPISRGVRGVLYVILVP